MFRALQAIILGNISGNLHAIYSHGFTCLKIRCVGLFELSWRPEESSALLASSPRWSEAEQFLDVLTNGHRAKNVNENERAFREVVAGQIAMAQSLDPRDWNEWQASNDSSVEAKY